MMDDVYMSNESFTMTETKVWEDTLYQPAEDNPYWKEFEKEEKQKEGTHEKMTAAWPHGKKESKHPKKTVKKKKKVKKNVSSDDKWLTPEEASKRGYISSDL
jgi:hypothetical protein